MAGAVVGKQAGNLTVWKNQKKTVLSFACLSFIF